MNREENDSKILYVACPYTHPRPEVRQYRYQTACRVSAMLMSAGIVVFSPLSHSVSIARHIPDVEMSHKFWMDQDIPLLRRCDELLVIGLDGWTQSQGVRTELFEAMALAKPITQIEEADIELLPRIPKTARHFLKSKILTEIIE